MTLKYQELRARWLERLDPDHAECVVAFIGMDEFVVQGMIKKNDASMVEVKVAVMSIAAADRVRMLEALPPKRAERLGWWSAGDRKVYTAFYVPLCWFDGWRVVFKSDLEVM